MPPPDDLTLTVDGKIYAGWTSVSVSRHLDHMASSFSLEVTERWAGQDQPWQIHTFQPASIKVGGDLLLTGYVEEYSPAFDANSHRVAITGRSKTADLIECTPDIASGQFKGYTLAQITFAIAALFDIEVTSYVAADQVFQDATLQRCETALAFLERLSRLSGVLLTDDASGRLILATAGTDRATTRLVQGNNILRATARLDVRRRFSHYIVKGQTAIGSASASWGGAGGVGAASTSSPAPVVTNLRAFSQDTGVPRYRPKVSLAEAQLDQAGMQRRATWERNYAYGRATEAEVTVQGWRQDDGTLWQVNRLVSVTIPWLQLDQDLLIAGTTFTLSEAGRTTTLQLGPVEGFTPDPGQVKLHTRKGRKGKTAPDYDGAGDDP